MLKPFLQKVIAGHDLSRERAHEAMQLIMNGEATPSQIAGLLVALRLKGESVDELVGFVQAMRERVVRIETSDSNVIDTCGTGGDGQGTLNISTAAAVVAAAAGAQVAKHGNRSVSSKCGSADLLETWGVKLDLEKKEAESCLRANGITFLFAPIYHPAMKHASGPRREMGLRTVFNLLGPMTNPAAVTRQVLGVFDRTWVEPLAQTLMELGTRHALVVSSHDGLDEISPADSTFVAEVKNGAVTTFDISPQDLGVSPVNLEQIAGGDSAENAARLEGLFKGKADDAAVAVALNAGAALYVAGKSETLKEGVTKASEILRTDASWQKLQTWVEWTQNPTS